MRTHSAAETISWGRDFAQKLNPGDIVCLSGDLGAGKTTLMRGLAAGLGVGDSEHVASPTFAIMHVYRGRMPVYHFDCYRLEKEADLTAVGFDEFVGTDGVACIEWPEKARSAIPAGAYWIHLAIAGENARDIEVKKE